MPTHDAQSVRDRQGVVSGIVTTGGGSVGSGNTSLNSNGLWWHTRAEPVMVPAHPGSSRSLVLKQLLSAIHHKQASCATHVSQSAVDWEHGPPPPPSASGGSSRIVGEDSSVPMLIIEEVGSAKLFVFAVSVSMVVGR